jgi:hypothetical protein
MSGVKSAEVRQKLEKVMEALRKSSAETSKNGERLGALGLKELDASRTAARSAVAGCDVATAPDPSLQAAAQQVAQSLAEGEREAAAAEGLRREAAALHAEALQFLKQAESLAAQARAGIQEGDWYKEKELKQAVDARSAAARSVDLERQAGAKLVDALDHTRKARNAFDGAAVTGQSVAQRIAQVRAEIAAREAARQAAEQAARDAAGADAELASLVARVESLEHDAFAPGEYARLQPLVLQAREAYARKAYAASTEQARAVLDQLRPLAQRVATQQAQRDAARAAASNDLDMARKETAGIDPDSLHRYGGDPAATTAALEQLEAAQAAYDRGDFANATRLCGASLVVLRLRANQARINRAAAESRAEIADSIMQALYDLGYDAPVSRPARERADGVPDDLSDIEIFAKHPGDQGDMRLEIDLAGKVAIRMDGIAEQDGAVCRGLISGLQEKLGPEVNFDMTDWGYARNAPTGPVQPAPAKAQVKVQQKTQERRGG